MTVAEAKKFLKDNGIKFVLAQFVDIHGSAKTKSVPVSHFEELLTTGMGFAGFAIWGLGMGPHGPEYMAVGDVSKTEGIGGSGSSDQAGHANGRDFAEFRRGCNRLCCHRSATRYSPQGAHARFRQRPPDRLGKVCRR